MKLNIEQDNMVLPYNIDGASLNFKAYIKISKSEFQWSLLRLLVIWD